MSLKPSSGSLWQHCVLLSVSYSYVSQDVFIHEGRCWWEGSTLCSLESECSRLAEARADWSGRQRCFWRVRHTPNEERRVASNSGLRTYRQLWTAKSWRESTFCFSLFSNYVSLPLTWHGFYLLLTFLFNLCAAVGSVSSFLKKRNSTVLNEIKTSVFSSGWWSCKSK